ncbi:MAG: ribonucleoside-diphosphate reductase, adenosylcobalamin-dependent [Elusimicrobia bacterium GWC2_51_8]|nr:MAG: ribonucleoside-diphosphate reductase, adenosylcobalamin-dependent [Elusimicrobia bacterium GWA2_51_34]OGR58498.1 MAG: ribonucleoside-diphosphate reductase, adenosylcobalamin-dependent [Elusimicrobia bacterium GWC2_51_8]HAF95527.1 adenosylcobalamin-dependent ribonucleoside-diphosphate reductase [Elusimicrobiota bacterium]HCE98357.1 adenosylcobalamin-dependent ribonucleoside-diphosphate reductase [Elusimicrobiota bacterium]
MKTTIMEKRKIALSENQAKVIKDKYLRDESTIEELFTRVSHNISLSEIIFNPDAEKWGAFEGVRCRVIKTDTDGNPARTILFHDGLAECSEREENFLKFISNLEKIHQSIPPAGEAALRWQTEFYNMMADFDFLPNSPTLMNAGRELQQLSACYVLPVPDSIEGIAKALTAQSLIQKSGGGTGFSFCRVRPKGDIVKKTNGVASGAISFMKLFDKMTDVVKQGGTRRGANMGILPYWHPEIKDFIALKSQAGIMENFNISVALDDKFMKAVENNSSYDLINPHTRETTGRLSARSVFNTLVESAWTSGDPGIVFIDKINETNSNPTPALGQIESTNPCGEQPLLPWESCNLGSINLANFVTGETARGQLDFERLGAVVSKAIRFLDNVIEINNYPLPEIEKIARSNRKIGLGVMGWAETAVKLGVSYDSPEGLKKAEEVMKFINDKSLEASEELAKERGVFQNWKGSIYDAESKYFKGVAAKPRNASRTTIAPTGTIAIAAGLQGSGIEPFFAVAYTRYNAKALESIKNGKDADAKDTFFEVNTLFKKIAEKNGYFGLEEKILWNKIDSNHKAVRGIPEIPKAIQDLFPTAHDVSAEYHVKIQAAFQKHTDNAVSKTINLPAKASVEDVRSCYLLAHKLGCKGLTIYRDGCKSQQVLNIGSTTAQAKSKKKKIPYQSFGVSSEYFQIKTGYGPLHIHINYNEHGPYQVFTNIPPLGTEISGLTALIGILLSKYLTEGGDPVKVLKHLNSVKGDRPMGLGENRINSIAHGIAVALRSHLKRTGMLTSEQDVNGQEKLELWEVTRTQYCPKCYSSNVSYESGCSGPTCHDCGYSECS